MGGFVLADGRGAALPGDGLNLLRAARPGGVDLLQHTLVEGEQLVNGGGVVP